MREFQRLGSNLHLAQCRTPGEALNGAAIKISCRKIHLGKGTACCQDCIDDAEPFNQFAPIDVRDQPHAGDDILHRDTGRALALKLVPDNRI